MSLLTIMTTSENATQKSMTRPSRSVHQVSFLWALCHELVRSTTHLFVAPSAAGFPFSGISTISPRYSSRSRVTNES